MIFEETYLVLGGGGMIGNQVVNQIARHLKPRRIVVASLHQHEVRQVVQTCSRKYRKVHFVGFWGDVFIRSEWNNLDRRRRMTRHRLLESKSERDALYEDLFGNFDDAYRRSQLVQLILDHKPDVIIDSINTATGISYQDNYRASAVTKSLYDELGEKLSRESGEGLENLYKRAGVEIESLLISQSVPQLVRHVLMLHRAMSEAGTRLYLKVGTTGTGGMGLNVPYTHSEDRPSAQLMSKNAIAFAHTGLLFLMARTPGGPNVKEIKPGAMVGYTDITCKSIQERGKPVYCYANRTESLGKNLLLHEPEEQYQKHGKLQMVVVDTGENGVFTKGEFEAITHMRQMEFVTPEEIAQQIVLEIKGTNTGYDLIAAIDSSIMNPSYRAGYLRGFALEQIASLEKETKSHSVALGQLGPPELGKLLWEAHLLELTCGTLSSVLEKTESQLAEEALALLRSDTDLTNTIISVGLPILAPDGKSLIRGPHIRIPEVHGSNEVALRARMVEKWANKGWVDLRPKNFRRWRQRFSTMRRESLKLRGRGSAAISREAYLSNTITIGQVVGWIFNNEHGGYRIK